MRITRLTRSAIIGTAMLSGAVFGIAGLTSAQATITNTGPDSRNTITIADRNTCTVTNKNDVDINNSNRQTARTGTASVSGNTGGSDWGAWDPMAWQARGFSYAQWHSAFMSYMSSHEGTWSSNWGHMGGGGGSATSGDASNYNAAN